MKILRTAAVIGIAALAIYVSIQNVLAAQARRAQTSNDMDSVSKWEKRIHPILEHVPDDVTTFGYVADWDIPNAKYNDIDQDQEYVLTQYVLAPRIVQPGLEHEWIIGNFIVPEFEDWLAQNLSSYKLTEIGFGIYLIHRTSP